MAGTDHVQQGGGRKDAFSEVRPFRDTEFFLLNLRAHLSSLKLKGCGCPLMSKLGIF